MTVLTEPAQQATVLMQLEAERLRHRYLGPEHLLLGLLGQPTRPPPACCTATAWTSRPSGPRSSG
jgi:hypothetical protein